MDIIIYCIFCPGEKRIHSKGSDNEWTKNVIVITEIIITIKTIRIKDSSKTAMIRTTKNGITGRTTRTKDNQYKKEL